ncbi:hypothetical protein A2U01_0083724, partial [Trifolium medium]|nr:hypothetical protein [Trifolium medium]
PLEAVFQFEQDYSAKHKRCGRKLIVGKP